MVHQGIKMNNIKNGATNAVTRLRYEKNIII
jgi:hypothetical protein